MQRYQQMLADLAFGNFRDVLTQVTLSPAMGKYLDMVNNAKPNAATGVEPNENYAREVMQLFAIGTVELEARRHAVDRRGRQARRDVRPGRDRGIRPRIHRLDLSDRGGLRRGAARRQQSAVLRRRDGAALAIPRLRRERAPRRRERAGEPHDERRPRQRDRQHLHASERRTVPRQAADPEARHGQSVAGVRRPRRGRVRQQRRWRARRPEGRGSRHSARSRSARAVARTTRPTAGCASPRSSSSRSPARSMRRPTAFFSARRRAPWASRCSSRRRCSISTRRIT